MNDAFWNNLHHNVGTWSNDLKAKQFKILYLCMLLMYDDVESSFSTVNACSDRLK